MRKNNRWGRFLGIVVSAAMLVTSSGVTALADETVRGEEEEQTEQVSDKDEKDASEKDTVEFVTRVYVTDIEGVRSGITDFTVRLYDADTWQDGSDNPIVDQVTADQDGVCRFKNLETGNYRVEYVSANADFDPYAYTAAELPEDAEYDVKAVSEETEEHDYFAWIGPVSLMEDRKIDLELTEISDEEISDGEEHTGTDPETNTGADADADTDVSVSDVKQEENGQSAESMTQTEETSGNGSEKGNTEEKNTLPGLSTEVTEEDVPESETGAQKDIEKSDKDQQEDQQDTKDSVADQQDEKTSDTEQPEQETTVQNESDEYTGIKVKELSELDQETVGAATDAPIPVLSKLAGMLRTAVGGTGWSFDAYYVGEDDKYYVKKDHDFNLKYQMEFHASQNLPEGSVEIIIPASLLEYRDGTAVLPSDIAVPEGTKDDPVSSNVTPFNYYLDELSGDLVFFNYKEITSGTNAAWQILYKNLNAMEIEDGTDWSLTPEITVTIPSAEGQEGEDKVETPEMEPLTGLVDTYANLSSVSKKAFHQSGKSYTPGLYTESQVESYITGDLPDKYSGENFQNYRFVVWEVQIRGNGTQPFNLQIRDNSSIEGTPSGEVVGFKNNTNSSYQVPLDTSQTINSSTDAVVVSQCKEDSWGSRFYVVTAYPLELISDGSDMENEIDVTLVPCDGIDNNQTKSDSAIWSYVDYKWVYLDDAIYVSKSGSNTYEGWLEVYKAASENGEDFGDLPYKTTGFFRGYKLTHAIDNNGSVPIGTYLDGKSYKLTTIDDFMYVYPSSGDGIMLDSKDYYYTSVSVRQRDVGYNVWEDKESAPEAADGIDQTLYIYAMYKGSTEWEKVAEVPWDASGDVKYQFTDEQLERQPWRVKAEHETINYSTTCDIDVSVRLRSDSPAMKNVLRQYEEGSLADMQLEDISGVTGASYKTDGNDKTFQGYCHSQSTENGNYSEPGLEDATKALYQSEDGTGGLLLQRDNAFKTMTGLTTHAASFKTARSSNDPDNGRVQVDYSLTAYDGYRIYAKEGIDYLLQAGIKSPGRNNVVFYDLLPYGMRFDPSEKVTAGRIINVASDTYKFQPGSWDQSQMTVTVDSDKDIIDNYRGTGRTMVVFHLQYDGADSAVYSAGQWMEGWGVSFSAYYDWKDLDVVQEGMNISAFMPEDKEDQPLYQKPLFGTEDEVACDDGIVVPSDISDDYIPFNKGDLNNDGVTDIRNVLYAKAAAVEEIVLANQSEIRKLVRADSDRFGVYRTSAAVEPGGTYTYDITVSNSTDQLQDIVVFDRLENAAEDRKDNSTDPMYPFEDETWNGTFQEVVTTGLEELGISPVIWYNTRRNAAVPQGAQNTGEVLTAENGWQQAKDYTGDPGAVKAVAVDLTRLTDGTEFVLNEMESVTFQIRMKAPDQIPEETYAYNNPSYYSYSVESKTSQTVEGNAARVSVGQKETLEIVKEFSGDVPEQVQDSSFEFFLYQTNRDEKTPFSSQEYQLWKKTDGEWVQQTDRLYATDGGGYLTLRADEKAVFSNLPDAGRIQVQETENPFWEVEIIDKKDDDTPKGTVRTVTAQNAYRSVLYAQKDLMAVPDGMDMTNEQFTFQICVQDDSGNLKPLADTEFWYVDSVRTDGGIPQKLGGGTTDENGEFQIKEGKIIALFPGNAGTVYELSETDSGSGDWICRSDTVSGTLPVSGASATITNIYKWKDLYLTKSLTHQDPEDCTQKFTFRICKVDGEKQIPVAGNEWVMLNEDGTESTATGESGTLDDNGKFICACAGRIVKIKGLEAGETYIVTETESGDLYRPVNESAEVTMPVYSSSQSTEITNDYLKRPLSVTKLVTYDAGDTKKAEEVRNKVFTMTVEINGTPLKDYPYSLKENGNAVEGEYNTDENGQFGLKNGQTAIFEDVGIEGDSYTVTETQDGQYLQIYPADEQPHRGKLEAEGSSVTFINGTSGGLTLTKEYEGADETAEKYVELMKDTSSSEGKQLRRDSAVTLTLKVTDQMGTTYTWPRSNQRVTVIDQLSGSTTTMYWNLGNVFRVQPWQTISLTERQLEDAVSYELTESSGDQHRVFEWQDGEWLEVSQREPADDQAAGGTLEELPTAKIINLISSVPMDGSEIEKRMAVGSNEVPEGAELVWRLERYDGTYWNPAGDVDYLTFDQAGLTCDRTLTTGADGIIMLTKTANGYPRVQFTKDTVYLNRYDEAESGDLRLIELTDESDERWGVLAGYGSADDKYIYDMGLSSEEAIAFVNSNRTTPLEIEKKMENPSDATFTMILEQVISASETPVTKPEQITKTQPGADISYTIHDTETGEQTGTGTTGKNGEIYLKAGQYARLDLPDGTLWTVREEQRADHTLKNLTGTPDQKVSKLADNLMLIQQKAEVVGVLDVQVIDPMVRYDTPLDKNNFEVCVIYSDQSRQKLNPEDYTLTPDTASTSAGSMEVTVHWNEGNLDGNAVLEVAGQIGITSNMVEKGVTDAKTGKTVALKEGNVEIPEMIIWEGKTYYVTKIENSAFQGKTGITGITIPDSVTSIGNYVFQNCSGLTGELKIPDSVTSIGNSAFLGCSGLTGELKIPDSVTNIGPAAFGNCSNLTSVEIPDSVTRIWYSAFSGCSGLTGELKIPDSVKGIEDYVFKGCSNLTSVEIPDSVTSIGDSAFSGCSGLTGELKIPDSVTSIGRSAFEGCSNLTSVEIPDSVRSIGNSAFSGCSGLTGELKIPNSVTSIGTSVFEGCSNLTSVEIPDSVRSIGNSAFSGCSGLTGELKIPDSVTSIGTSAFSGCSGLTGELKIPDSVTSIRDSAFSGCSGLTGELKIPDSVTSIRQSAFEGCSGLISVKIPNSITRIEGYAFSDCVSLTSVEIPDSVTYIGTSAFEGCSGLTGELKIPDSVTYIGVMAFEGCSGLTGELKIPDSVTYIGLSAFRGCKGLTSVEIPDSITSISSSTFRSCSGLTSVEIPDSVTSIGDSAFEGCSGLTSVEIPDSVTSIGDSAFSWCWNLTSVEIPDSVTSIGQSAFEACSGLTSVEIPNSVTSIGAYVFRSCSDLTSVEIPDSVTSIGIYAFSGCSGLTSVEIPDSVTSIGFNAFYSCSGLTGELRIPNSVTKIGSNAFSRTNFSTITIDNTKDAISGSPWGWSGGADAVIWLRDDSTGTTE